MRLLNQNEVAKKLGVSVSTLVRLRDNGRISYLPWRPILFDEADVETYVRLKTEADCEYKAWYNPDRGTPEWAAKQRREFLLRLKCHAVVEKLKVR